MRCKVANLNPNHGVPWALGQNLTASTWSSYDTESNGIGVRRIFHYSTMMLEFWQNEDGDWLPSPHSVGCWSVSDQNGCNKILGGIWWRYVRAGGARFVCTIGDRSL